MTQIRSGSRKSFAFTLLNLLLLVVLPLLSVVSEHFFEGAPLGWVLFGKWFVFWSVGMRLFLAGIKQASSPEFTATGIFKLRGRESFVVIRQLGFAKISLGVMGILSVLNSDWRLLAAFTGGLYFGLIGMHHLLKKSDSKNELIAMGYALIVFLMIILYLLFTL